MTLLLMVGLLPTVLTSRTALLPAEILLPTVLTQCTALLPGSRSPYSPTPSYKPRSRPPIFLRDLGQYQTWHRMLGDVTDACAMPCACIDHVPLFLALERGNASEVTWCHC
eukprot:3940879-Rhodomonas_salina.1